MRVLLRSGSNEGTAAAGSSWVSSDDSKWAGSQQRRRRAAEVDSSHPVDVALRAFVGECRTRETAAQKRCGNVDF